MLVKIRITADDQEISDAAREFLRSVFGDRLTLAKGRPGSNPKYEGQQKVLAYGELDIPEAWTEQAPPTQQKRRPRRKKNV
jgi:hypothetical protein